MKTLVKINVSTLVDYEKWKAANLENWDISKYLNQFYDINAALALSKLYFPDFIEVNGCVVLLQRYDEQIFNQWHREFNGVISLIEEKCNLYEVADLFHINEVEYPTSEIYNEVIAGLANALKISWELNLKHLFLDRQFKVHVYDEYGSTYITIHSL